MKLSVPIRMLSGLLVAALAGLSAGCIGGADLTGALASETNAVAADGTADPNTSGSTDTRAEGELTLLRTALAASAPGGTAGDSTDSSSALGDLKRQGLSRRDMAVAALDLAAAQTSLSPDQQLALRLARAYLARDWDGLERLVLEQVLAGLGGVAPN